MSNTAYAMALMGLRDDPAWGPLCAAVVARLKGAQDARGGVYAHPPFTGQALSNISWAVTKVCV